MPVAVDLDRAQFRLAGSDLEPTDLAWTLATPAQRKGYWREVAVLARDRKFAELHKGIGVDGQRLPRRKAPRHDHAAGPVLSPHWSDSRFRTQLRWEGTDRGAVLWWKSPWGRIVGYHARGEVRGAPVRNVIGLTWESQQWIVKQARKWWAAQVQTGRLGAGATTMGGDDALVAAAQAAGTFSGWRRVAPPRPDLFRPLAPARPVPVPAPTLAGALAPWQAIQRVHELWESAGHGKTTRAQLERTAARLGRTQTLPTLQSILVRWGVVQPPRTKAEAVELVRRNLLSRLTLARPGRGPTPPPPPKPAPVPAPVPPVEPPKPVLSEIAQQLAAGKMALIERGPLVPPRNHYQSTIQLAVREGLDVKDFDPDAELEIINATVDRYRDIARTRPRFLKAVDEQGDNITYYKDYALAETHRFTTDPQWVGWGNAGRGGFRVERYPYTLKDKSAIQDMSLHDLGIDPIYVHVHESHHGYGSTTEFDTLSDAMAVDVHLYLGNKLNPEAVANKMQSTLWHSLRPPRGDSKRGVMEARTALGFWYSNHPDAVIATIRDNFRDADAVIEKVKKWAKEIAEPSKK